VRFPLELVCGGEKGGVKWLRRRGN
jgi:hypothetical protein